MCRCIVSCHLSKMTSLNSNFVRKASSLKQKRTQCFRLNISTNCFKFTEILSNKIIYAVKYTVYNWLVNNPQCFYKTLLPRGKHFSLNKLFYTRMYSVYCNNQMHGIIYIICMYITALSPTRFGTSVHLQVARNASFKTNHKLFFTRFHILC